MAAEAHNSGVGQNIHACPHQIGEQPQNSPNLPSAALHRASEALFKCMNKNKTHILYLSIFRKTALLFYKNINNINSSCA